ncbi:hypothetical protein [Flaviaesturariibacter aridisoli]|uniref:Uncharacterized protein n=1 Tax=Flaviaesturariibacter aridisoli TaxID=2545761 RepID=A0A4R4DYH1_9BACT|nr:hypothetical protein [Flaviaesturariibacter aridisoli]TCZ70508.1 hypothetical protein E0486_11165 [Flaviaesturariibacter aridisoli]
MAPIHRGSELNNVKETWNENERNPDRGVQPQPVSSPADGLQSTIQREAEDYDHTSKNEQLLGGDRASINDE